MSSERLLEVARVEDEDAFVDAKCLARAVLADCDDDDDAAICLTASRQRCSDGHILQ